jgi:hypothetical protein
VTPFTATEIQSQLEENLTIFTIARQGVAEKDEVRSEASLGKNEIIGGPSGSDLGVRRGQTGGPSGRRHQTEFPGPSVRRRAGVSIGAAGGGPGGAEPEELATSPFRVPSPFRVRVPSPFRVLMEQTVKVTGCAARRGGDVQRTHTLASLAETMG